MALRYGAAYVATLIVLLALDFAWLGTVGGPLFKRTLGDMLMPNFSVGPAVLFYVVYAIGIVYFAETVAFEGGDWTTALLRGALFGFFAYLTYDMTNLATLRNYTAGLAATDIIWGTVVTAVSATAGFWAAEFVIKRFG